MKKKRVKSPAATWTNVGNTWSKYGRALGKVALEGVADALKKTAAALHETDRKPEQKSGYHVAIDSPEEHATQKASHEKE